MICLQAEWERRLQVDAEQLVCGQWLLAPDGIGAMRSCPSSSASSYWLQPFSALVRDLTCDQSSVASTDWFVGISGSYLFLHEVVDDGSTLW